MPQRRSQRFSTKPWRRKKKNVFILYMYITTRRGQCCVSVRAPVCLCQVITMFLAPLLPATLSGRLHCPLLAAHQKCRALQITDHQFESFFLSFFRSLSLFPFRLFLSFSLFLSFPLSFFLSFQSLCNPSLWLIHTSVCYLLLIYSHKYFLCFYIWWSVTDWTAGFKQNSPHMSSVWSLT